MLKQIALVAPGAHSSTIYFQFLQLQDEDQSYKLVLFTVPALRVFAFSLARVLQEELLDYYFGATLAEAPYTYVGGS